MMACFLDALCKRFLIGKSSSCRCQIAAVLIYIDATTETRRWLEYDTLPGFASSDDCATLAESHLSV